jgi:hypothetical protein
MRLCILITVFLCYSGAGAIEIDYPDQSRNTDLTSNQLSEDTTDFDIAHQPPALTNPTEVVLPNESYLKTIEQYNACGSGKVYVIKFADDEDALVTFNDSEPLPYPVHVYGGRNVIIRGLDIELSTQPGNEIGSIPLDDQEYNQTNPHPVVPACGGLRLFVNKATHWVEGLHLDTTGHDADGIIVRDADPARSKVVIQNSLIKGIEGNLDLHGDILQTQSGHLKELVFENVTMQQALEGIVLSFPVDNVVMRNINYDTDLRFDSDDPWDDLVSGPFFAGSSVQRFNLENIYIKYKEDDKQKFFMIGGKHFSSPEAEGEIYEGITTEVHPEVHFEQMPSGSDFALESQVGSNYISHNSRELDTENGETLSYAEGGSSVADPGENLAPDLRRYVDAVDGNDNNNGKSQNQAWFPATEKNSKTAKLIPCIGFDRTEETVKATKQPSFGGLDYLLEFHIPEFQGIENLTCGGSFRFILGERGKIGSKDEYHKFQYKDVSHKLQYFENTANFALAKDLRQNTEYRFFVQSSIGGKKADSIPILFTTPYKGRPRCPKPPAGLKASFDELTRIAVISWEKMPGATSYTVARSRYKDDTYDLWTSWSHTKVSTNRIQIHQSQLEDGEEYKFVIRSHCGNTVGPWSWGTPASLYL